METSDAVAALSALAQENRLAIFRLLVARGPDGLSAGVIADRLAVPASSLSFHLAHLTRAGLIVPRRLSRQLIYAADFAAMNDLVGFLTDNCCGGDAALCEPSRAPAKAACGPSCAPSKVSKSPTRKRVRA